MVFERALNIVKSEVKLKRTFPIRGLDAEFSPAPGPGWEISAKTKHVETVLVAPKTAIHHNVGDAEFCSLERHHSEREESPYSVEQM